MSVPQNEKILETKMNTKIQYKNESFLDIGGDIPLDNLSFYRTKDSSKKFLIIAEALLKYKYPVHIVHSFLRISYFYDTTNIDVINKLALIRNQIKTENNFVDETDKILQLYKPIIQKQKYFYFDKIFELIELLSQYEIKDINSKCKIEEYIMKFKNLKEIINKFNNDISPKTIDLYLFTLYYNWLFNLARNIEKSNQNSVNIDEIDIQNFDGKIDARIVLENGIAKIYEEIAKILDLEYSKDMDSNEFEEKVNAKLNKCILEMAKKNLDNNKPLNENLNNPNISKIEEMLSIVSKKRNNLKTLNNYFNSFYTNYLPKIQYFLTTIPNTLSYLKNLNYDDKLNIYILTNFVFFLSYFEFDKEKFSLQVDYYENRFKTIGFDNNENIIIKDNILYLKYLNKRINDFNDYNLTFSLLKEIEENRFLLQQYMKFDLYPKKNLFNKYIETYLNFFKDLFLKDNSCLKSLFIKTFPVLKSNYFINEEFLEYIFHNKIYLFNFYNSEFVGLTEHANLNISLKGNYSKNNKDEFENEICVFASFIVILIHELAHFIRMYIYKHLKIAEYESSFYYEKDEKPEIGRFIEKKIFGRVIEKMNLLEAFYILDIDNYLSKNIEEFKKGFMNIKTVEIKDINTNVKKFLESVDIEVKNIKILEVKNEFTIKGNPNLLNIGKNNDKRANLKEIERVYNSLEKQYKDFNLKSNK